MDGRSVPTNRRALSRRVVAGGVGGGAAVALGALGFPVPARAAANRGATPSVTAQALPDAWAAAWSSGDGANVADLFAEDGVYEDVPFEAQASGRAAIAEHARAYFDGARDVALKVEAAVAIPGGYVVQWRDEYTSAATGTRVSYRGSSILEVGDGMIVREVAYYDRATIAAQEGGGCGEAAVAGTPEAGA